MNVPSRLLALAVSSLFATAAVAQYAPAPPPPPPPAEQGAIPPPPPPPPAAPVAPTAPAEQQSLPAPPPPPPPPQPVDQTGASGDQTMAAPEAASGGMSEERSVQFQNQQGATVTVNYGMPAPTDYGPKPAFSQLDTNHDGHISKSEAQAYPLLANDWLHVAHHADSISKAQYQAWSD